MANVFYAQSGGVASGCYSLATGRDPVRSAADYCCTKFFGLERQEILGEVGNTENEVQNNETENLISQV